MLCPSRVKSKRAVRVQTEHPSLNSLPIVFNMPSHGRKKSKKTGVLGQALISDRFGRKGVFRASDANLPENAKQLLANQHFLDDEEKMSTKLRSVCPRS